MLSRWLGGWLDLVYTLPSGRLRATYFKAVTAASGSTSRCQLLKIRNRKKAQGTVETLDVMEASHTHCIILPLDESVSPISAVGLTAGANPAAASPHFPNQEGGKGPGQDTVQWSSHRHRS